jgi:glycosyltransferase involved in cell wall biosynthesis
MTMETPALVSIILPTYNRAALLRTAVESVFQQSHTNWELLIVDDGSTDETPELLHQLAKVDMRLHCFRQPNEGPSSARNAGLSHSEGVFVTFLDSDDTYLPEHIGTRVRFMLEHPKVDFLHGGIRIIGSDEQHMVADAGDRARRISLEQCVAGGTFFARKGVIEKAGGWRTMYGEDYDLFERVSMQFRVEKVSFPTYLYHRTSPDSRCTAELNGAA